MCSIRCLALPTISISTYVDYSSAHGLHCSLEELTPYACDQFYSRIPHDFECVCARRVGLQ